MNVVSLEDRIAAAEPSDSAYAISATPYVWREPSLIPQRQWLYGRTLLRGSLSMLVAPGASGKTALLAGMALSLVSGRDLLGSRVWEGPSRVWLWNLEDSADEMARLIQAGAKHWGLTSADLDGRLFLDCAMSGNGLILADDDVGVRVPVKDALADEMLARHVDVLMLDPLVSAHRASENDNGKMDELAKALSMIAETTQSAILAAHHTAKLKGTEANAEAARGASALVNAARSVPSINKMTAEEANQFGIKGDLRRRYFRVYDDKGNRAPPADTSSWFHLHSIALNNGPVGDDGDSLPVVVPWSPPDAFDGLTGESLRRVQAVVAEGDPKEGTWKLDPQTKSSWVGVAIAGVLGFDLSEPSELQRTKSLLKGWLKSGALRQVELHCGKRRETKSFVVAGDCEDTAPPL